MCELYHLLGITISASTVYHPQSDCQTEHVNQELEQYIWVFISECQNDWDTLLPIGEFMYNNHVHSSMQHSPFFLNTGRHPQIGSEPNQHPSKLEAMNEFADWMNPTLNKAWVAISKLKNDMARHYNRRWTPALKFAVGKMVFLDASDISMTRPSKKFAHQYLRPYPIIHPCILPQTAPIHVMTLSCYPCCQTDASPARPHCRSTPAPTTTTWYHRRGEEIQGLRGDR